MRKPDENLFKETDAAIAAASILLNLLIVLILTGSLWFFYSIISHSGSLGWVLQESIWR